MWVWRMWFKTWYHLHSKAIRNGVRKHGGWFKTRYHLLPKEKINGVHKHGGCDSKHDITYPLRKK